MVRRLKSEFPKWDGTTRFPKRMLEALEVRVPGRGADGAPAALSGTPSCGKRRHEGTPRGSPPTSCS